MPLLNPTSRIAETSTPARATLRALIGAAATAANR